MAVTPPAPHHPTGAPSTDDFDAFSARYDQLLDQAIGFSGADAGYFAEYKVDFVLARERGAAIGRLLDLGCGVGNATLRFAQALPHTQFDGVDVSIESVARAQQRVAAGHLPRTRVQAYDGAQLPFADASFDLVFIAVVLHHVPVAARPALLREVHRVLRPGGRLYIFEHNPYNPLTRKVVRECPFDANAVLLSPAEGRRLARQAGFGQVQVGFRVFIPPHPALRWALPLEAALEWLPLGGQYFVRALKP